MPEITATDAARNFADLLDAVEHRGEHYSIVRRGRVVAQLEPQRQGRGSDVKALLRGTRRDSEWSKELMAMRQSLVVEER